MQASNKLLTLLLHKHSKDLCVPECKVGSSWFTPKCPRFDLWVMRKSWTKPYTIGYEIKQNRNDFLRDTKWVEYLEYCTDFYFVAPPNIIQPEELPENIGLLVSTKNIARLYTKRKAVHRDVEIPESIFRYILMWRIKVIQEGHQSQTEYWQNWLAERNEKKDLGYKVSHKIRQLVEERIDKVESENYHLKGENEKLGKVKDILKALGFDDEYIPLYSIEDKLRTKIDEIEKGIPEGLSNHFNTVIENLTWIKNKFIKTE